MAAYESGVTITDVRAYKVRFPYKKAITFVHHTEDSAEYVIVSITASNGSDGIAESVCRPAFTGEDATTVSHELEVFFKPLLMGKDPCGHLALLAACNTIPGCRAAKALLDVALWDLRGKIFERPVWSLLGGTKPKPVPLSWIAHGATKEEMVAEAKKMAETRGYKNMKLKAWRRTMEDIEMIRMVREALPKAIIYIDGNGTYSEGEAKSILPHAAQYGISFFEEPCEMPDHRRQAELCNYLPLPLLGDQCCETLEQVFAHVKAGSVGAVSVKPRRTGITESLKIIALCEAARLPVVIGTDSESRIGSAARMHLRSAIPSLAPWPTETHFFDKLKDDCFVGEFNFADGAITPSDAPGFGASLDKKKLEQFLF